MTKKLIAFAVIVVLAIFVMAGRAHEKFASVSRTISGAAPSIDASTSMAPQDAPAFAPMTRATALAFSPAKQKASGIAEGTKAPNPTSLADASRKIITTASVTLLTEDLTALDTKLQALINAQLGYVSNSSLSGNTGTARSGNWTVRVPVDHYDAFMKGAVGLGELKNITSNAQDVGEEYFDLEARSNAKKVEETRLLKHLTETTGKLEEILAVERELSRVRSDIEQMQGRLRYLSNQVALATVMISASEEKGFIPAQAPTLGTKIARTFGDSVDSIRELGEGLLLLGVSLAPWLPIIAVATLVAFLVARKFRRRVVPTTPA